MVCPPKTNRIGEKHRQKCGLEVEIIAYRNNQDVNVRFTDGTIIEHRTYTDFKRGNICHPNDDRYKTQKNKRIGKKHIQNCGLEAEIIDYNNVGDITIAFPDGIIVKQKIYRNFMIGAIKHPTLNLHHNRNIGKIYPKSKSKIYHTEIHGIAYTINNTHYYFCHCPICQTHEIWTFNEIKLHTCNQKLAKERDKFIQTFKTRSNTLVT